VRHIGRARMAREPVARALRHASAVPGLPETDRMVHLKFSRRLLSALVAYGALSVRGPAPVDAQSPTFKSSVDMVPLTVTVTDPTGKYVTGLTGDDFTVFEDGVAQPLSFFASTDVPVDVALVLDASGSMGADLPIVKSAALGLVGELRSSDRGAVVTIKDSPAIPQPFTSDRALIEQAIHALSTSGDTALYDGLYLVLREFERERRATLQLRRQVLVLLSDGLDNASHLEFEDVMDLARRVGVSIYVIAIRGDATGTARHDPDGLIQTARYTMVAVARESGGRCFFPTAVAELPAIYVAIAQELATQYELGYMPARPGGDGAFRHVAVRVPLQTNVLARTRSGYYAARARAVR
jgi:Ca-activated chloride channel family protein